MTKYWFIVLLVWLARCDCNIVLGERKFLQNNKYKHLGKNKAKDHIKFVIFLFEGAYMHIYYVLPFFEVVFAKLTDRQS